MQEKKNNHRRGFIKKALATGALAIALPRMGWADTGTALITDQADETGTGLQTGNNEKSFTVLFQGDSITDGNRTRNNDWNHVMGHGYACLIASRLWYDHTDEGLHFFNRGISGNKVTDLAARWQPDTLDIKPDLLSILVGVNDANSMMEKSNSDAVSPAKYEEVYRQLLKDTMEKLPSVMLVICEPFLLPVGKVKDNWDAWSAEIRSRQAIAKKLAAETGAIYVQLQDTFNNALKRAPADYWIWDGIHPMPAGHELMARQWIKTVGKHISWVR